MAAIAAGCASRHASTWICCPNATARYAQRRVFSISPIAVDDFELLRGKDALTVYTFETGVAEHAFCSHCGMHGFYIPRSQPDRITVNARCLDDIDGPSLKPTRFFEGRHWDEAQRRRIDEGGHVAPTGFNGAVTLKRILDRASE